MEVRLGTGWREPSGPFVVRDRRGDVIRAFFPGPRGEDGRIVERDGVLVLRDGKTQPARLSGETMPELSTAVLMGTGLRPSSADGWWRLFGVPRPLTRKESVMSKNVSAPEEDSYGASMMRTDGVFCPGRENAEMFGHDLAIGDDQLEKFARAVRRHFIGDDEEQTDVEREAARQEELDGTGRRLFAMAAIAALRLPVGGDLRVSIAAVAPKRNISGMFGNPGDWPLAAEIYVIRLPGRQDSLRFVVLVKNGPGDKTTEWFFELAGRDLVYADNMPDDQQRSGEADISPDADDASDAS